MAGCCTLQPLSWTAKIQEGVMKKLREWWQQHQVGLLSSTVNFHETFLLRNIQDFSKAETLKLLKCFLATMQSDSCMTVFFFE